MPENRHHPWLHRFAVSTVLVAMITLVAGALVTSKNAGMAFRDWPTSDGQAMLTYPWLADFARNGDKFLEHGHRLAGMLIGVWSIALAGLVAWFEQRRWVKVAAFGVLSGVICQGILGGFRVWFDERGLAMLHGAFAACVLSLMAIVATSLSRGWQQAGDVRPSADRPSSPPSANAETVLRFARMAVAVLAIQYLLGGMIRHGGTALHEHLGLGLLACFVVGGNAMIAHRSRVRWVRNSGWMLLLAVLGQVLLGGAAWVMKFGFGPLGYVAVADSIQQIAFRTAHTVWGIVVVMTSAVHAVRAQRAAWVGRPSVGAASLAVLSQQLPAGGSVA